jgi:hypothetical protein
MEYLGKIDFTFITNLGFESEEQTRKKWTRKYLVWIIPVRYCFISPLVIGLATSWSYWRSAHLWKWIWLKSSVDILILWHIHGLRLHSPHFPSLHRPWPIIQYLYSLGRFLSGGIILAPPPSLITKTLYKKAVQENVDDDRFTQGPHGREKGIECFLSVFSWRCPQKSL